MFALKYTYAIKFSFLPSRILTSLCCTDKTGLDSAWHKIMKACRTEVAHIDIFDHQESTFCFEPLDAKKALTWFTVVQPLLWTLMWTQTTITTYLMLLCSELKQHDNLPDAFMFWTQTTWQPTRCFYVLNSNNMTTYLTLTCSYVSICNLSSHTWTQTQHRALSDGLTFHPAPRFHTVPTCR